MSAATPQHTHERPPRPMWMLALFAIAAVVGLFNIGAFLYGLTLPSEWSVEQSVVIDAPPDEVAAFVVSPRRWSEWSSWSDAVDPTAEFKYDGPEAGAGSSFAWLGEQLGYGKLTITEASDTLVRYRLEFQGEIFSDNGRIAFEPNAAGTQVVWTDGGEVNGTIGRFFRERLEESVAADFQASLQRLKRLAESQPPVTTPPESTASGSSE